MLTVVQTRMQILNPTPSAVYSGIVNAGYRIGSKEGFRGLWRGMSSVVVGAGRFSSTRGRLEDHY